MDDLQGDAVLPRGLLHPGHPVAGIGTLVGIVEDESVPRGLRMLGAVPELRRRGIRREGQIEKTDAAVGHVRHPEALVGQELRIRQELPLAALGGEDAETLPPLSPGVPEALPQQVVGAAVPLQGTRDPQAVDVELAFRPDGNPLVLRREILYEALAPLLAPVKNQALLQALPEPRLLEEALLAGHAAADVLPVDVVPGDAKIVHAVFPPE